MEMSTGTGMNIHVTPPTADEATLSVDFDYEVTMKRLFAYDVKFCSDYPPTTML
jgi:hypothetical protein